LKLRVQLRSFDAVCRLVECNAGRRRAATTARRVAKSMAIKAVDLTTLGAARSDDLHPRLRRAAAYAPSWWSTCGGGELPHRSVELERLNSVVLADIRHGEYHAYSEVVRTVAPQPCWPRPSHARQCGQMANTSSRMAAARRWRRRSGADPAGVLINSSSRD